jgi:hypothetical protein
MAVASWGSALIQLAYATRGGACSRRRLATRVSERTPHCARDLHQTRLLQSFQGQLLDVSEFNTSESQTTQIHQTNPQQTQQIKHKTTHKSYQSYARLFFASWFLYFKVVLFSL